jgi:Leucine-rich repeat (LRR) protein
MRYFIKKKFILLLIVAAFVLKPSTGFTQVTVQDSLELVAFYNATGGNNWSNNQFWLSSLPVSNWHGVTVANGRVSFLLLAQNNLTGQIPASISNLSAMVFLALDFNQLSGSIPPEFGSLSNLGTCYLNNNQLSGNIPSTFGNLTSLGYLHMENNLLTGSIPSNFSNFSKLINAVFDNNQFTGSFPSPPGSFPALTLLSITHNLLDSIPHTIGNMTALNSLDMSYNHLKDSIPYSIGNLTALNTLNLDNNQLSGAIPSSLGNFPNLNTLDVSYNQLTGSIPSTISNDHNLEDLYLNNNHLSGAVPSSFSYIAPQGPYINITNNNLTFAGMQVIVPYANIGEADYAPQYPIPLIKQNNLLAVAAGDTKDNTYYWYKGAALVATITGDSAFTAPSTGNYSVAVTNSIATELTLTSDTVYTISHVSDSLALIALYNSTNGANWIHHTNWLTNNPLNTWYGITMQTEGVAGINLVNNNLTGYILPSLDSLSYLKTLNLGGNKLTFTGLEALAKVYPFAVYSPQAFIAVHQKDSLLSVSAGGTLSNNYYFWFNGSNFVYEGVNDSTYIATGNGAYSVIVSNNIADSLALYSDTVIIYLHKNSVQDSLALVDLYNKTNGAAWATNTNWLTKAPLNTWYGISTDDTGRVTDIELSNNNLTGYIPSSIGNIAYLQDLSMEGNILTDSIPSSIGNLTALSNLEIGYNQLSSTIPSSLGNLSNLEGMDLSGNLLTGSIPSAIGNLSNLSYLILAGNQLSGPIPSSLGNLSLLGDLELEYNQLSGTVPSSLATLANSGQLSYLGLDDNKFTFAGMEAIAQAYNTADSIAEYWPQASIPLNRIGNNLFVSAGGTLAHETFRLYKNGLLDSTKTGDSSFIVPTGYSYSIIVTNSIANELTLYSDTINFNSLQVQLCPPLANTTITSQFTAPSYQWQLNTGSGFNNITDNSNYTGTQTASLQLKNIPSSWYGYQYRCVANGNNTTYSLQFEDVWTGAISSAWTNASNWSCGAVPDGNTDVIINSGATVVLSADASVRSITVNPGASFTVMPPYILTITH